MGKPFSQELEKLDQVYDWAVKSNVSVLSKFLLKSANLPMYVIGSGGSFSATTFASILHQEIGMIARCITPLEFLEYQNITQDCSILIVTAGGNNKDILSSFEKTINLKPKNIGILCASINNKLTRRAFQEPDVLVHALKLPSGKDGFLATNSLFATMIWLIRAYIEAFSLPYFLPSSYSSLINFNDTKNNLKKTVNDNLEKLQNCTTIVFLHDNWSKTAAFDAESKLVEAGLVNVQLADYRNFAHGRHNWLDKNKDTTGLIALINPQCETLALKTLDLIPDYTPTTSFSTTFDGPLGSIDLFLKVLYIVQFFGNVRKIDPGRPGVATFGRKIYHLSIPKSISSDLSILEQLALRKKFGKNNFKKSEIDALRKFKKNLSDQKFGAVIFDYDGTLCDVKNRYEHPSKEIGELLTKLLENDIVVGIATGRGKSVRQSLQKIIPKEFWSKVYVGYYNCADISSLGDDSHPNTEAKTDDNLTFTLEFLKKYSILPKDVKITPRPNQLTLESELVNARDIVESIEKIDKSILDKIRIVESSHSVDLLSVSVSKMNLFEKIRKDISSQYEILCIGDRGKWPGNDFELLDTTYSLSVDEVSLLNNSCWNLITNDSCESLILNYFTNCMMNSKYVILGDFS